MKDQRRQEIIDKWYGGNAERYETETAEVWARVVAESFGGDEASANADREAGRRETIH